MRGRLLNRFRSWRYFCLDTGAKRRPRYAPPIDENAEKVNAVRYSGDKLCIGTKKTEYVILRSGVDGCSTSLARFNRALQVCGGLKIV